MDLHKSFKMCNYAKLTTVRGFIIIIHEVHAKLVRRGDKDARRIDVYKRRIII